MQPSIGHITFCHQLLVSLAIIIGSHHVQPLLSAFTCSHQLQPSIFAMLQQLICQQLNWSVKFWETGRKTAELLKAADMQTHVCTKFSRICAHFCLLNATVVKIALLLCSWHNLTWFYGIFSACLCAKFYFENSVCAKDLAFRRSGKR